MATRQMKCFALPESVCWCQTGRYGDLMILAPIWKACFDQTGKKQVVYVCEEFADILEGMSYVAPMILKDYSWHSDLDKIKALAEKTFDVALVPKFWDLKDGKPMKENPLAKKIQLDVRGRKIQVDAERWSSYQTAQWESVGFTYEQMKAWPLVFDKRNKEREADLISRHLRGTKPLLLVNFSGASSPFSKKHEIMAKIMEFSGHFQILDIGSIRAERIYDLLGLFDIAAGLVTIDTSTLHLARASKVPVIALINEGGNGSVVNCNCALQLRYSEAVLKKHQIGQALNMIAREHELRRVRTKDHVPKQKDQRKWTLEHFDFSTTDFPLTVGTQYLNCGMVTRDDGDWLVVRRFQYRRELKYELNDCIAFPMDGTRLSGGIVIDIKKNEGNEHFEDARVVFVNGKTFLSCTHYYRAGVQTTWPNQTVVWLDKEWKTIERFNPIYGNNTGSPRESRGQEKNWVWFDHKGFMHMVYMAHPHKVVEFDATMTKVCDYETTALIDWNYGPPRGGTPPVKIGKEYWSFFHSSKRDERIGQNRYYMGVYAFEAKPPFNVTRFSSEPIYSGSMNDGGSKPVVFPCGAIYRDGIWTITIGINDVDAAFIKIPHVELLETLK